MNRFIHKGMHHYECWEALVWPFSTGCGAVRESVDLPTVSATTQEAGSLGWSWKTSGTAVPSCARVNICCSFIWEPTSFSKCAHPLNSQNTKASLREDKTFFHVQRDPLLAWLIDFFNFFLGPVRVVCTSSWRRLKAARAWATRWIRAAVFFPASPNWCITTAPTDCLSQEPSTWPCSTPCPGNTEQKRIPSNVHGHWAKLVKSSRAQAQLLC